jgi:hypothetical protein
VVKGSLKGRHCRRLRASAENPDSPLGLCRPAKKSATSASPPNLRSFLVFWRPTSGPTWCRRLASVPGALKGSAVVGVAWD